MSGDTRAPARFTPRHWRRLAVCLLVALGLALAAQAVDPDRWSDWSFGEAQVMLSLRQWDEQGWLANRFLLLPQGYAKPIRHLDDPDLRQHAHGIAPGSSPAVGARLWYTHYPAGYLLPYAALAKVGLGGMAPWRLLSLAMSLGALFLMYLVFAHLAAPPAALAAVAFYAFSPSFLGYADAVANQPFDDLLRFGFLLAVVLSTRAADPGARRRALLAAWGLEFLLSLGSFDSVFFLYLWLVGWDLVDSRRFRWRKYLVFACAPLLAHGLQFLQNVWYLGWDVAVADIASAFLQKSPAVGTAWMGRGGIESIARSAGAVFGYFFTPAWLLGALALVYALWYVLRRRERPEAASHAVLLLLLVCGLAFEVVLPHTAWMPYEGRQMAPFAALLVGSLTWAGPATVRDFLRPPAGVGAASAPRPLTAVLALVTLAAAVACWGFAARNLVEYRRQGPLYAVAAGHPDVPLAKALAVLPTEHDPVYFDAGGFRAFWNPSHVRGYPQIHPMLEYYAGFRPILCFFDPAALAADVEKLARRAPREFSPVLVSRDPVVLRYVVGLLEGRGLLRQPPSPPRRLRDAFVVDLTPAMAW